MDINSNKIVYRYTNNNFADLIEMAEYKLHYFPARGRAELIRLMFVAGGAKFEDIRIPMSEWASKKKCKSIHASNNIRSINY